MKPFDNAYPQAREWEQEADRYGYVVIAPELRAPDVLGEFPLRHVTSALKSDEQATVVVLNHVFATTNADPRNVLSTGWSSGGYMAHYMLNRHPERFTCLGVRQSNFSSSVLDPQQAPRSDDHPIFIINTENDFTVCRKESREGVAWYEKHGYSNVAWVIIKDKGHERTPDLAADFFSRVSGVTADTPPVMLARRQAIEGNAEGIAMLSGQRPSAAAARRTPEFLKAPTPNANRIAAAQPTPARVVTRPPPQQTPTLTPRGVRDTGDAVAIARPRSGNLYQQPTQPPPRAMTVTPISKSTPSPAQSAYARSPLSIRVSSAIGIEPLHLGFSAECPANWRESADFLWTINDQPVGNGIAGQKTISESGSFSLGLVVVTATGQEFRAQRTVRVLPRLQNDAIVGRAQ
jgi:predicted esterase